MRKIIATLLIAATVLTFGACGNNEGKTIISLADDGITVKGDGASAEGSIVTVTAPGKYELSGSLTNGRIVVNSAGEGDVELIFNGIDVTGNGVSPVCIMQAKNTVVTLADGSTNKLTDLNLRSDENDEADAALYSKDDLFITGNGSLVVNAEFNDGIAGKDDLNIDGGNITVTAENSGIKGKDSMVITGGQIDVTAKNDGVKATNDTEAERGYVDISGGSLVLKADDDAISAFTEVRISGGTIKIDTPNNGVKCDGSISVTGGVIDITTGDDDFKAATVTGGGSAVVTVNGQPYSFN